MQHHQRTSRRPKKALPSAPERDLAPTGLPGRGVPPEYADFARGSLPTAPEADFGSEFRGGTTDLLKNGRTYALVTSVSEEMALQDYCLDWKVRNENDYGSDSSRWVATQIGPTEWMFTGLSSGRALQAAGSVVKTGVCKASDSQKWNVVPTDQPGFVKLCPLGSQLSLTVGRQPRDGVRVNAKAATLIQLVEDVPPSLPLKNGRTFNLISSFGKLLFVPDDSEGSEVFQTFATDPMKYRWVVTVIGNECIFSNLWSGLVLDGSSGVAQRRPNWSSSQRWRVFGDGVVECVEGGAVWCVQDDKLTSLMPIGGVEPTLFRFVEDAPKIDD